MVKRELITSANGVNFVLKATAAGNDAMVCVFFLSCVESLKLERLRIHKIHHESAFGRILTKTARTVDRRQVVFFEMNAIYFTVSIPLLLVLAGFNHAHGLTTFGKSNSQNTQQAHPPPAQGKSCTSQADCTYIKETTCLNSYCYCGDNKYPRNGVCKAEFKGASHICNTDNECVEGANCIPAKDRNKTSFGDLKICVCEEGLYETPAGHCGGTSNLIVIPGFAMIVALLASSMN